MGNLWQPNQTWVEKLLSPSVVLASEGEGSKNEIRRDGVIKKERHLQKSAPHRSAVLFPPPPGSSARCSPSETQTVFKFANGTRACLHRSQTGRLPSTCTQAAVINWIQQRRGKMRERRAEIRSRRDQGGGGIGWGDGGGGLGAA